MLGCDLFTSTGVRVIHQPFRLKACGDTHIFMCHCGNVVMSNKKVSLKLEILKISRCTQTDAKFEILL